MHHRGLVFLRHCVCFAAESHRWIIRWDRGQCCHCNCTKLAEMTWGRHYTGPLRGNAQSSFWWRKNIGLPGKAHLIHAPGRTASRGERRPLLQRAGCLHFLFRSKLYVLREKLDLPPLNCELLMVMDYNSHPFHLAGLMRREARIEPTCAE